MSMRGTRATSNLNNWYTDEAEQAAEAAARAQRQAAIAKRRRWYARPLDRHGYRAAQSQPPGRAAALTLGADTHTRGGEPVEGPVAASGAWRGKGAGEAAVAPQGVQGPWPWRVPTADGGYYLAVPLKLTTRDSPVPTTAVVSVYGKAHLVVSKPEIAIT